MYKFDNARFLQGPNLYFSASGILLTIDSGRNNQKVRPGPGEVADMVNFLRDIFPGITESSQFPSVDDIQGSRSPLMAVFLAVAEISIHDFCVEPRLGHVITWSEQQSQLFVPCESPAIGEIACKLSMSFINNLHRLPGNERHEFRNNLIKATQETRFLARQRGLSQLTMTVIKAAVQQDIPYYQLDNSSNFIQLGQAALSKHIEGTKSSNTSSIGVTMSHDKLTTSQILMRNNLPSANTQTASSIKHAIKIGNAMGFPLVVKPRSGLKGQGVTIDINNQKDLETALHVAAKHKTGIIIERFIQGEDHRLLVVDGRFIAAAKRFPACISGDGHSTVKKLVEKTNRDPRRGLGNDKVLVKIELDQEALQHLTQAGLTPDSVPDKGRVIVLRGAANIARGGSSVDVTDEIHPDNRELAERAAGLLDLNVAGIDFLTTDIGKSWRDGPSAIVEVNAGPGLRVHLGANPHRNVALPIIRQMFPDQQNGRIPTIGITGSLGKTTTSHMVAAILRESGKQVGISTTQGAWVGKNKVLSGDVATGSAAQVLLKDRSVEAGVFELARGGLIKKGMGIDGTDIGIMLNVFDNHLGLDGINTREEMARVKRLVVQQARKLAVLNADDPLCMGTREYITAPRLCLVSTVSDNPEVRSHMRKGGLAAYIVDDSAQPELTLWEGSRCIGRIHGNKIADSWDGRFRPALTNALFAMAAAYGLGIDFDTISTALSGFRSRMDNNPGRNNFYQNLPYSLVISHADGNEAVREFTRFADTIEVSGSKRLLTCAAGNRPDEFIRQSARAVAGHFSCYVCTNFYELRGRHPEEVPRLLATTLEENGVPKELIHIVPSQEEAINLVYTSAQSDDLIVDNTFSSHCDREWLHARGLSWLKDR